MTDAVPTCPDCGSEHTYELGGLRVCSMCAHEWSPAETEGETGPVVRVGTTSPAW